MLPLVLVAVALAGSTWLLRRRFPEFDKFAEQLLGGDGKAKSDANYSRLSSSLWVAMGLALLAVALTLLERMQPYYFTQDDALVAELPGILAGCRGVWEGHVPNYNPYQFLGSPLLNVGFYSLTYPPTYFAYGIARHLLHDEYATLEIFAILHIVAGFLITASLARRIGMSPAIACLVSLSFVLSGSILVMGRSWHTFLTTVFWLPVLGSCLVRLKHGPVGWGWMVGTGLALGLVFHVGFPQLAFYEVAFFGFSVLALLWLRQISWDRAKAAIPASLIGIGLALPLVLQQWSLSRDLHRERNFGFGIIDGVAALFLPYPLAEAKYPNRINIAAEHPGHFYFFGGLFAFLFVLNGLLLITSRRKLRSHGEHFWFFAGAVAFWLALGGGAGLWLLATYMPIVGWMNNYPFRVLPFFVFCAVLAGGMMLERLLRLTSRRRIWEIALALPTVGVLLYHVGLARACWYTYDFRPYPALDSAVERLLKDPDGRPSGRLFTWNLERVPGETYARSLVLQMPSVYGIPAFHGYDPVAFNKRVFRDTMSRFFAEPHATMKAYGVRWHVIGLSAQREQEILAEEVDSPLIIGLDSTSHVPLPRHYPCVFKDGDLALYELVDVDPLAFPQGQPLRALPVQIHAGGMDIDLAGASGGGPIVVNFLHYPEIEIAVDGRRVACAGDEWNRIVAEVPAGSKALTVRYSPHWRDGIVLGACAVLAGAILGRRFLRVEARRSLTPAATKVATVTARHDERCAAMA